MTPARARRTLAARIALVTAAVAAVAVVLAGLVAVGLIRSVGDTTARARLADEADSMRDLLRSEQAQTQPGGTLLPRGGRAAVQILNRQQVTVFVRADDGRTLQVGPARRVRVGLPGAGLLLSAGDQGLLAAQQPVSASRDVAGRRVFLEARSLSGGQGFVALAQPVSEVRGVVRAVLVRGLLALGIGLLVAVGAGVLLARRLARPLQQAAGAALRLAGGQRGERLRPDGPLEVAEVADALNTLAGALEHSEGRQREFLLSVSHELRTPLTAVRGFAEALADGVTAPADVPAAGAVVLAESQRLERLVTDLLDLARLGARDFRIDPAQVDLGALLDQAGAVWRVRCEREGVRLHVERPPYPLVVVTDGGRVRQLLDGLAENALRVTPAGRPVVLAAAAEPGGARVEVRDGGPGLTDDDLSVAFERSALYDRYRGVRRVGTGVGLALVAGLAARLGGRAEAGHAAEGGARFTVHLPADPG